MGESCRAAGWEASARWEATAKRVNVEWQAADAKYELRQRWERFDLAGKCKAFDEAYDVRGKLRQLQSLLVLYVWKPLLAQWARLVAALEMRGITPRSASGSRRAAFPVGSVPSRRRGKRTKF